MFTSSFSGPVDNDGRVLGHPPIHIHHIHITTAPGVVTKMRPRMCMTGEDPNECYVADLVVEQHGDYQCTEEDGGIDCFFEKTADGYAKIVAGTLDLEGEVNDVRAKDSEPMTWWYQVVLRWFPRTLEYKPLSQLFIVGPGIAQVGDQRTNVLIFPVNTKEPSLYWYSGPLHYDGEMIRNKLHAHNTMFDRAFFFRAHPEELGLDDPQFWPDPASDPVLLKDTNFDNFDSLESYLLKNLAKSAEEWDSWCPQSRPDCRRARPALTCQSWVANQDFVDPVSGKHFAYDRRAPCCCRKQSFSAEDIFTVVAFMQPLKTTPGPWSPDTMPATANMHIHWLMTFTSPDNKSHYNNIINTQNPDKQIAFPEDLSRFPVFSILDGQTFVAGPCTTNNQALALWQRIVLSFWWLILIGNSMQAETAGICFGVVLFIAVVMVHWFLHRRYAKRAEEHFIVQCAQGAPCLSEATTRVAVDCVRATQMVQHDE